MLNLSTITLVCVDTINIEGAVKAITKCMSFCKFGAVKLFTSRKIHPANIPSNIEVYYIKINDIDQYSLFILKELHKYISTDFAMIIQHDGFIVNEHAWQDTFLKYDYIGAPWNHRHGLVGNGGFSIRSKRLLERCSFLDHTQFVKNSIQDNVIFGEDHFIAFESRLLLQNEGFSFAPTDLASNFSVEFSPYTSSFGLHGNFSLKHWEVQNSLTTIIVYCSNEQKFIKKCIDSVSPICRDIIVVYGDRFFDGSPENKELIQKSIKENPRARFIEMTVNLDKSSRYNTMKSRIIGFQNLGSDCKRILWLDADEVVDTKRFNEWMYSTNFDEYDSFLFACYWYFRENYWRSKTWEQSQVLSRRDQFPSLDPDHFPNERFDLFSSKNHHFDVRGLDNKPLIHHYAWVRTKDEMLKKVTTWGHNKDRNWVDLVEKEFQRDFNESCRDFVHNYEFEKCEVFSN